MKSKKFFTKYNEKNGCIFLSKEDAKLEISEDDLLAAGKKTQYKGVKKFKYRSISLYPFQTSVEFTLNSFFTEKEKKRLSVLTKGDTVELIGVYSDMEYKGGCPYRSCAVGSFFYYNKICKKQRGIAGATGDKHYNIKDKDLFKFFEDRGYKKELDKKCSSKDRMKFMKTIHNDDEANATYDDIHQFDKLYYK